MNKLITDDHVLPRPAESLPEYAHAKARQALAARVIDAFHLSEPSAAAIANAVVDPSEVRKLIGEPTDPDVEKIPVPGGTLLGVRTAVWARRIMPDPRNPRTLPSRRHPFAIDPGMGSEDSKFRPAPEPRALDPDQPQKAELAVDIESRHQLTWASQQAAAWVLAENDWRASIASQGVMEAVWLVATTYQHADGSAPATVLTTAEGSSRTSGVHDLLSIRSADVAYDDNETRLRAHIRKLNEAFARGPSKDDLIALRCERIPALILVGFEPHPSGNTGFPTAVKSLVALRHVDPPTPWGDGPENESLADEVLDELYRRDLISSAERDYFAASCTKAEAKAAHLAADPALRAARIVELFARPNEREKQAIRVAVTSQSTRKNITPKLMNELATALILRAAADNPAKVDRVRRYLRAAFSKPVHRAAWQSTGRTTDQLVKEALTEVQASFGSDAADDPGPASLELAVRASYPLIVSGRLNADRGSRSNDQPDRRTPGEVLDAMRRSIHGVHQLGQALRDYAADTPIRAVDEDGQLKHSADGSECRTVNDVDLRNGFPPPGKARAPSPGDTPHDRYNNALNAFGAAIDDLARAFQALSKVTGDDGEPLIDTRGLEPRLAEPWRQMLKSIDDKMLVWAHTFKMAYGIRTAAVFENLSDRGEQAEVDPFAEFDDDFNGEPDTLDRPEESTAAP